MADRYNALLTRTVSLLFATLFLLFNSLNSRLQVKVCAMNVRIRYKGCETFAHLSGRRKKETHDMVALFTIYRNEFYSNCNSFSMERIV